MTARFPFPCPPLLLIARCGRDGGGGAERARLHRRLASRARAAAGAREGGAAHSRSGAGAEGEVGRTLLARCGRDGRGGSGAAAQAQAPCARGCRRTRQAQDAELLPCLQQCLCSAYYLLMLPVDIYLVLPERNLQSPKCSSFSVLLTESFQIDCLRFFASTCDL